MNPQQITELIQRGLPGSRATVASEDNVHFEAVVVARGICRSARRTTAQARV